jgi:hypothetical protein
LSRRPSAAGVLLPGTFTAGDVVKLLLVTGIALAAIAYDRRRRKKRRPRLPG